MSDPPDPELPDNVEETPRSHAGLPVESGAETADAMRGHVADGSAADGTAAAPVMARPIGGTPAALPLDASQAAVVPRPPAVWPAIVIVLAGFTIGSIAQIAVVTALEVASGPEGSGGALADSPVGFVVLNLTMEGAFAFVAVLAAAVSVIPVRRQLGLTRPGVPGWGYAALLLGTLACAAVGEGLSMLVPVQMIDATGLRTQMTWADGVLFVGWLSIVPGFVEELLFRGYLQRRLLQRWRPAVAIAVSTLLFALVHFDPRHMVFAAAVGLWLGVVAWRTGSIWPCVFCHAGINALWNIYSLSMLKLEPPEHVVYLSVTMFLGSALIGLVVSIRLLVGTEPPPTAWYGLPDTLPAQEPLHESPLVLSGSARVACPHAATDKHPDL
jgi:membrane protease YdiL (CAAX protease family)